MTGTHLKSLWVGNLREAQTNPNHPRLGACLEIHQLETHLVEPHLHTRMPETHPLTEIHQEVLLTDIPEPPGTLVARILSGPKHQKGQRAAEVVSRSRGQRSQGQSPTSHKSSPRGVHYESKVAPSEVESDEDTPRKDSETDGETPRDSRPDV